MPNVLLGDNSDEFTQNILNYRPVGGFCGYLANSITFSTPESPYG
jgi:hypothetical protein